MEDKKTVRLLDKRVARRNIHAGRLKQEDYDKYISALPDLETKAAWVEMDLHDTEAEDLGDALDMPESDTNSAD